MQSIHSPSLALSNISQNCLYKPSIMLSSVCRFCNGTMSFQRKNKVMEDCYIFTIGKLGFELIFLYRLLPPKHSLPEHAISILRLRDASIILIWRSWRYIHDASAAIRSRIFIKRAVCQVQHSEICQAIWPLAALSVSGRFSELVSCLLQIVHHVKITFGSHYP